MPIPVVQNSLRFFLFVLTVYARLLFADCAHDIGGLAGGGTHPAYELRRGMLSESFQHTGDPDIKVVFLDADGTLRVTKSGSITPNHATDAILLPGVAETIKKFNEQGYLVAIVSNQGGIPKYISLEDADRALHHTVQLISDAGAKVDYFDFAESLDKDDPNRKPNIGMAERLERRLKARFGNHVRIDRGYSVMVGDAAYKKGNKDGAADIRPDGSVGFDFSNSDRLFAERLGIWFSEPDSFFGWDTAGVKRIESAAGAMNAALALKLTRQSELKPILDVADGKSEFNREFEGRARKGNLYHLNKVVDAVIEFENVDFTKLDAPNSRRFQHLIGTLQTVLMYASPAAVRDEAKLKVGRVTGTIAKLLNHLNEEQKELAISLLRAVSPEVKSAIPALVSEALKNTKAGSYALALLDSLHFDHLKGRTSTKPEPEQIGAIFPRINELLQNAEDIDGQKRAVALVTALNNESTRPFLKAVAGAELLRFVKNIDASRDQQLFSDVSNERQLLANLLGDLVAHDRDSVDELRRMLRHPNHPAVHDIAMSALGQLPPDLVKAAVSEIVSALKSDFTRGPSNTADGRRTNNLHQETFSSALYLLGGKLKERSAIPDIVRVLKNDSDWVVRSAALRALAATKYPEALSSILDVWRHQGASTGLNTEAFVKAVAEFGDLAKSAVPALKEIALHLLPADFKKVEVLIKSLEGNAGVEGLADQFKQTRSKQSATRGTGSPRYFGRISKVDLEAKIQAALTKAQDYKSLTKKVEADLKKVNFDTENLEVQGFETLDSGLVYLAIEAGGDWEAPVHFIIYWDGIALRGYIPTEGNPWNTDTKEAYGNDEEADALNAKERFPALFGGNDEDDFGEDVVARVEFDHQKIRDDITKRLIEKK